LRAVILRISGILRTVDSISQSRSFNQALKVIETATGFWVTDSITP
jgi:hypothetical protein